MSLINIIVLSFKFLVDCWDVFVYGRGWPHASQVCCDTRIENMNAAMLKLIFTFYLVAVENFSFHIDRYVRKRYIQ